MERSGQAGVDPHRRMAALAGARLGSPGAIAAARERTMSERLELALSWNAVAAELHAGLAAAAEPAGKRP